MRMLLALQHSVVVTWEGVCGPCGGFAAGGGMTVETFRHVGTVGCRSCFPAYARRMRGYVLIGGLWCE
jgi:hypothetical protein